MSKIIIQNKANTMNRMVSVHYINTAHTDIYQYVLIKYHCSIVLVSLASIWLMKFCSGIIIYTYLISTLIPPTQTLMSVVKGFLDVLNYVLIPLEAIDVVVSMDTNLELITTHLGKIITH